MLIKLKESMKVQDTAADLMGYIVDDLRDYTQIQDGMFKKSTREFNVMETVNKVISLVRDKARSNEIEIRCSFENFPEHSFNIFSDEQRLKQVLLNITSNAIKFTKKGFVHLKIKQIELGEYRYL